MNDVYVKPWCRIAPYAVGLLLGYSLYELYRRSNTLSWDSILPQRRIVTRYNRFKTSFCLDSCFCYSLTLYFWYLWRLQ